MLVVVALLAVALALAPLRPGGDASHALRAAREVRSALVGARVRALAEGGAVAVRWDAARGELVTIADPDPARACRAPLETPGAHRIALPRGARIDPPPRSDLAWLPDGRARSCAGGGVANRTLRITAGRSGVAVVIVARAGRVRIERRSP